MDARNIEESEARKKACEIKGRFFDYYFENGDDGIGMSSQYMVEEIIDVLTHPIDGRKDPACKFWEDVLDELSRM